MALIDIRDLTFAYPGSYDNVFEHLSLQLDIQSEYSVKVYYGSASTKND